MAKNVLGTELQACSFNPKTGVFRDGYCSYTKQDPGLHIVAAQVTQGFLEWNKARGNDLITPKPEWQFIGLQAGDWWCICMGVWLRSREAGHPLKLKLEACHEKMLDYLDLEELKAFAV
ncbi:hypothetical protein SAMN05444278_10332 [Psychroflexus salarius]|uniref:DUF2237 domain-containing protein n=1 Tax=Psychroflexus salarius TaxID=1155689 RepID=A0A1M4UP56_9FLAO|nr:DUF2237 domain-containing protein [Psychroflexus salarius]SHE58373.1 hypothetical protein SAMN05444278_10332 [Psychroflexus salarius]